MNPEGKKTKGLSLIAILLILSAVVNMGLAVMLMQVKTFTAQAMQAKDNKMIADRNLYTNLAARLHNEMKKSATLEEELKKYRRDR